MLRDDFHAAAYFGIMSIARTRELSQHTHRQAIDIFRDKKCDGARGRGYWRAADESFSRQVGYQRPRISQARPPPLRHMTEDDELIEAILLITALMRQIKLLQVLLRHRFSSRAAFYKWASPTRFHDTQLRPSLPLLYNASLTSRFDILFI